MRSHSRGRCRNRGTSGMYIEHICAMHGVRRQHLPAATATRLCRCLGLGADVVRRAWHEAQEVLAKVEVRSPVRNVDMWRKRPGRQHVLRAARSGRRLPRTLLDFVCAAQLKSVTLKHVCGGLSIRHCDNLAWYVRSI